MLLSVKERIVLGMALENAQGDFRTLKQLRVFREELGFEDAEQAQLKMVATDGGVKWDLTVESDKDIEIGESITEVIIRQLKALDANKTLTDQQYDLYEKFVEKPDEAATEE